MASPFTIVSTAISVFSSFAEGAAADAQAKAQARIYEQQARQAELVAERNAQVIQQRADYQAERLKEQALKERAIASQRAAKEGKKRDLTQSRALAVAGASGGGLTDPTVTNIYSELGQEGDYNVAAELFYGETAAASLTSQADLTLYDAEIQKQNELFQGASSANILRTNASFTRYQGQQARTGSYFNAGGSLFKGASSLYDKYAPTETWANGDSFRTY